MALNIKNFPRHHYTLEEYFALEQVGEARFEYWDGDVVCMSGGSQQHYTISDNLHARLARLLEGGDCRANSSAVPIQTPSLPPYRYPDSSVTCGKAVFTKISGIDVLTNPIVIVEVLSPETELLDKEPKRVAYQKIPSVVEYLLVSQDAPHITHYLNRDGAWTRSDFADQSAFLELPSIKIRTLIADIYRGATFD